jgi:DNA-binding NarL/FixJ family response regulator
MMLNAATNELGLSESTVRLHAESVFARLDVNSRRDVETVIRTRVMDALYPRTTAHLTTHERPVH